MIVRPGALMRGPKRKKVWYDPAWTRCKELTIPAGAVEADLTDQVVSVLLAGDTDLAAHAQPDGSDIVICGDDKTTVLDFYVPRSPKGLIAQDGGWVHNHGPRMLRYEGTNKRTYIGALTAAGNPFVVSYDHDTKVATTYGTLRVAIGNDIHAAPALLLLSSGKFAAFYTVHNGAAYFKISTNAEDITAWGAEQTWTTAGGMNQHTYNQPFRLTGESNQIYVFFRGGPLSTSRQQYMASTTEAHLLANTWDSVTQWLSTGLDYPYPVFCSNDVDEIHVAFTQTHPNTADTDVYYAKHKAGKWYNTAGTEIGDDAALPIQLASFEKVYDHTTAGRAWVWDIQLDGTGKPAILYSTYPGSDNTHAPDHRLRYARWNGSTWDDHEITATGTGFASEIFYNGGACLDQSNVNIVYLSRNNAGGDNNYHLEKWTTADNGATWTSVAIASTGLNMCPTFAKGAATDGVLSLAWMTGTYTSYTNCATQIITSAALAPSRLNWLQNAVVKVPSILAASDAKAYLYYGNSNPTDQSDVAGTLSAVQFMAHGYDRDFGTCGYESKAGASMLKGGRPTSLEVAGKIGRAQSFTSGCAWALGTFNLANRRTLSIMGWVKGATGYIIANLGSDASKAGMYLRINSASHKLEQWMRDSAGAAIGGTFEATVFAADTWHHIAWVFDCDAGNCKAWIDGTQSVTVVTATNPFAAVASDPWNLGYCANASTSFTGALEGIRVYPAALTEAQIKADYAAANSPETFIEFGAEETK